MLLGVYKRSIQGNASAENASIALTFGKICSERGWSLLQLYQTQKQTKFNGMALGKCE